MFGYIIVNKQEMKFKEFDLYQSYYCGFCQELKKLYGKTGQLTLSYDLTFLILLLTSLYETDTVTESCKCIAHPFEKHPTRRNEFSSYAADMNLLLSYYKCEDDWLDERKVTKKALSGMLKGKVKEICARYPGKAQLIQERLDQIHQCEQRAGAEADAARSGSAAGSPGETDAARSGSAAGSPGETDSDRVDRLAGYFGDIMAEIFAVRQDEWEKELRRIGFFMGKFIYLMDAYEDVEKDKKEGSFNPFSGLYETEQFEESCERILTMMMAECSRTFEKLPLIEYTEILRNILYSGVWCRYELVRAKRSQASEESRQQTGNEQ